MRRGFTLCLAILAVSGCNEKQAPSICVPVLSGWASPETGKPVHLIANSVTLNGRNMSWNGVAIDEQRLTSYVRQTAAMDPLPFLIFDPGVAPDCSFARHIRDVLDREYPCSDGACWQGSEAELEQTPFKSPKGNAVP